MMHHEAGVRTVVAGGRPQIGPMQGLAGSRGAQIYQAADLDTDIFLAEEINVTVTADLPNDQDFDFRVDVATFNLRDQIRRDENFPLQFAYEAADCRIFYTPQTFNNYAALWQYAADAIWTNPKLCVQGSTNQPSAGNITDTVGPTAAEKASWVGRRSGTDSFAAEEKRSPSLSRIHGAHGLDFDIAGKIGALCPIGRPGFCGRDLVCVRSPYCDPRTYQFFPAIPQCQIPCGQRCPSQTTCQLQLGNICLAGNAITAEGCRRTKTVGKSRPPVGLPNQPQSKPPHKARSVVDFIVKGMRG